MLEPRHHSRKAHGAAPLLLRTAPCRPRRTAAPCSTKGGPFPALASSPEPHRRPHAHPSAQTAPHVGKAKQDLQGPRE